MEDKKPINRHNSLSKILVFISLILLFSLGIHYRPSPSFDYSKVQAVENGGMLEINFEFLSGFDYDKGQIPKEIKELNGKKIAITGFMLPVDFDEGKVTSFILLNNQMACCFGIMPVMNEFIYVKVRRDTSAKFLTDIPVTVLGTFEVGQENIIGSLYGMNAEKVEIFKDF